MTKPGLSVMPLAPRLATAAGCMWIALGTLVLVGALIVAGASIDSRWAAGWAIGILAVGVWLVARPSSVSAGVGSIVAGLISAAIIVWWFLEFSSYDQSVNIIFGAMAGIALLLTIVSRLAAMRDGSRDS